MDSPWRRLARIALAALLCYLLFASTAAAYLLYTYTVVTTQHGDDRFGRHATAREEAIAEK